MAGQSNPFRRIQAKGNTFVVLDENGHIIGTYNNKKDAQKRVDNDRRSRARSQSKPAPTPQPSSPKAQRSSWSANWTQSPHDPGYHVQESGDFGFEVLTNSGISVGLFDNEFDALLTASAYQDEWASTGKVAPMPGANSPGGSQTSGSSPSPSQSQSSNPQSVPNPPPNPTPAPTPSPSFKSQATYGWNQKINPNSTRSFNPWGSAGRPSSTNAATWGSTTFATNATPVGSGGNSGSASVPSPTGSPPDPPNSGGWSALTPRGWGEKAADWFERGFDASIGKAISGIAKAFTAVGAGATAAGKFSSAAMFDPFGTAKSTAATASSQFRNAKTSIDAFSDMITNQATKASFATTFATAFSSKKVVDAMSTPAVKFAGIAGFAMLGAMGFMGNPVNAPGHAAAMVGAGGAMGGAFNASSIGITGFASFMSSPAFAASAAVGMGYAFGTKKGRTWTYRMIRPYARRMASKSGFSKGQQARQSSLSRIIDAVRGKKSNTKINRSTFLNAGKELVAGFKIGFDMLVTKPLQMQAKAEEILEQNRRFMPYSGTIMQAFNNLAISDMYRNMKTAQGLEKSVSTLATYINMNRESIRPMDELGQALWNRIGAALAATARPFLEFSGGISGWLNERLENNDPQGTGLADIMNGILYDYPAWLAGLVGGLFGGPGGAAAVQAARMQREADMAAAAAGVMDPWSQYLISARQLPIGRPARPLKP